MHYVLDKNGDVKEEPDLITWARWFEDNREARNIGKTIVGNYTVSTCFLGLDHRFPPDDTDKNLENIVVFETMVFENKETEYELMGKKRKARKTLDIDGTFQRYATREQAEAGHEAVVRLVGAYQLNKNKNEQTKAVGAKSQRAN